MSPAALTALDQFAAVPFADNVSSDHRTFCAPGDRVAEAIATAVGWSTTSQMVAMFSFTDPSLVAAVVDRFRAGVPTLVVLDNSQLAGESEKAAVAPLFACVGEPGFRLSIGTATDGHEIMHDKIYVGDGSLVITGSYNWTESAARETNQTTIAVWPSDAALLVAKIEALYEWQLAHCPQTLPSTSPSTPTSGESE